MRIGVYGGSFNPIHMGHLNCLSQVMTKTGLDQALVVPTARNPLKKDVEGADPQQRMEMVRLAIESQGGPIELCDLEIKKGGVSYTVDTLRELQASHPDDEFFLIIGQDNFDQLSEWKSLGEILSLAHLIVTSRPGYPLPTQEEDLPQIIRDHLVEFDFNFAELKTGKSIQFVSLKDTDVSATELRKRLRSGRSLGEFVPLAVENYIRDHKLYQPLGDKIGDYEEFTRFCAQVLFDRKAIQVRGFDLRQIQAPSEFTLVAGGTSTRHASSLAENVMRAVKEEFGVNPLSIEGMEEGRWVLLDYGSLIIHLFYDFVRQEYQIEQLWTEGVDMRLLDRTSEPSNEKSSPS